MVFHVKRLLAYVLNPEGKLSQVHDIFDSYVCFFSFLFVYATLMALLTG